MSPRFDHAMSAETFQSGQSSLASLFSSAAQAHAQRDAIVEGDKVLSYQVVDEKSGQLAQLLLDQGLQGGCKSPTVSEGAKQGFAGE